MQRKSLFIFLLAALCLLAFQPVPTPTPIFDARLLQQTAPSTSDLSSAIAASLPLIIPSAIALLALLVAFGKSRLAVSDQREEFMSKMANQALELGQRANKATDAADKAEEAARKSESVAVGLKSEIEEVRKELGEVKKENSQLKSTVDAQASEINTLKKQVQDLTASGQASKEEIKERDAEIRRLNAELYRVATAAPAPGMQQPPPPPAGETPAMKVEVTNLNPIEVTETPKGENS